MGGPRAAATAQKELDRTVSKRGVRALQKPWIHRAIEPEMA
jgi:hypothetical protein